MRGFATAIRVANPLTFATTRLHHDAHERPTKPPGRFGMA
jgi:hypothetical protein